LWWAIVESPFNATFVVVVVPGTGGTSSLRLMELELEGFEIVVRGGIRETWIDCQGDIQA
jgi:hypothetical protein